MTRRGGRVAAALVAAALLPACGEPKTAAEYAHLRMLHLAVGAAAGLLLMALVLAWRAWRRRDEPQRFALGPPSDTAVAAAYSSLAAIAVLVMLGGVLLASVALPDDPVRAAARQAAFTPDRGMSDRVVLPALALLLFALPLLAALGALFADFVEYPPRGPGAVPVALVHALLAYVVLNAGPHEPAGRELVLRWLLAAPVLAGTVAYLALHVGWWRSATSVPRRRT